MTFAYSSTILTLQGSIMPVGVSWQTFQRYGVALDGTTKVRDRNEIERLIKITLAEGHAIHDDIVDFIRNKIVFRKNKFTFTPDSGVDVGNGAGTAIYARYWDSNFVEKMTAWHNYNYEIILRYAGNVV